MVPDATTAPVLSVAPEPESPPALFLLDLTVDTGYTGEPIFFEVTAPEGHPVVMTPPPRWSVPWASRSFAANERPIVIVAVPGRWLGGSPIYPA
jgi:hypothetical protein